MRRYRRELLLLPVVLPAVMLAGLLLSAVLLVLAGLLLSAVQLV